MTLSTDTLRTVRSLSQEGYKYGFVTDIEADEAPPGLTEDTVRFISAKKEEPEWLISLHPRLRQSRVADEAGRNRRGARLPRIAAQSKKRAHLMSGMR